MKKQAIITASGVGILILAIVAVFVISNATAKNGATATTGGAGKSASTITSKNTENFEAVTSESTLEATVAKYKTYEPTIKDKHLDATVDEGSATKINVASSSTLNITKAGTYILQGKSSDFKVTVNAGENAEVRLVLDGVELSTPAGPVINAVQADHLILVAPSGTRNTVADLAADANEDLDSAIYSEADLVIIGDGALAVTGASGHAIHSKGDINLKIANLEVVAADSGIKTADSLYVLGGGVSVSAENDGLRANDDLVVAGGNVKVTKSVEGFEASRISITGGSVDIQASDDGLNASDKTVEDAQGSEEEVPGVPPGGGAFPGGAQGGEMPQRGQGDQAGAGGARAQGGRSAGEQAPPAGAETGAFPGGTPPEGAFPQGGSGFPAGSGEQRGAGKEARQGGDWAGGAGGGRGMMGGGSEAMQTGVWIFISGGSVKVNATADGLDSNGCILVTGGALDLTTRSKGSVIAQGDGPVDANGYTILRPSSLIANGVAQ